jgi:ABC-type methionine transport system ATPase subunit
VTGVPPAAAFALRNVVQERGGRRVLEGVSVELPSGEITALIGPSGAGKTSLLRLLNRLDDPVSGDVELDGRAIASYPVRALRRRVGFVFQSPTMFPGTVADNLRVAATLGADPNEPPCDDAAIARLLDLVELSPDFATRDANELSGGEKQRVSIARALTTHPRALLLDEPTSALDPEVAERLMATVRHLNGEHELTIVMVTHRLSEARAASTYAVMLEAGRVVETGGTARLFAGATSARTRAYLAAGDDGGS